MRATSRRAVVAAAAFAAVSGFAFAQTTEEEVQKYRKMVAQDNPGELWEIRGETLFKQRRGAKNASLEQCDFGLGPGVVKGAYARLPRYFADADRVMDMETRLVHCMVTLQGFTPKDAVKTKFGNLNRESDVSVRHLHGAVNQMPIDVLLEHAKERKPTRSARRSSTAACRRWISPAPPAMPTRASASVCRTCTTPPTRKRSTR